MKPFSILVIGRNKEIHSIVLRIINKDERWQAQGALTDEEAIELFSTNAFDMVLLGSGISETSEALLRATFLRQNPTIAIIQHYGGGSGLLYNEILEVYNKK